MKQYGSELKDKWMVVVKKPVVILAVKARIKAGPEMKIGSGTNSNS
jgi:hypothetical protein